MEAQYEYTETNNWGEALGQQGKIHKTPIIGRGKSSKIKNYGKTKWIDEQTDKNVM